ncbi:hypothetical protein VTN02DRAFT_4149 [Thermoascus thermophilus]
MSALESLETKSLDWSSFEITSDAFETPSVEAPSTENNNDPNILKEPDPNDTASPQNWSRHKKNFIFVALMSSSILADGAMTWGASLIVPQAVEWGITTTHSATSMNYGILLQGFGGILAVPFIEAYGRLPTWLWPQIVTLFMVLGATLSHNWVTFTVFRSLQGFFGTVPQVVGLPIIHDMYAPKDWPRMVNIWGTTFLVGPFLGPAIAGYIADGSNWRVSFGVLTILYIVSTLMIFLFAHETYYVKGERTQVTPRLKSLFGIGNTHVRKRATLADQCKTLTSLIFKLPLLLTGIATMVNTTWPIGITTTVDAILHAPPYLFNTVQASSMRFAGVIGALCGFTFGFFFNEWIFNSYRAHWRAEYRLHGVWFAVASMACGLLTYGLTLNFGKHWIGLASGWVMVNTGMVSSTVAITAYALEKYPDHSTSVSAIVNMWRTCGGFSVAYFQPAWIAHNGAGVVFGIQAAIVAICAVLTITPVLVLERPKPKPEPELQGEIVYERRDEDYDYDDDYHEEPGMSHARFAVTDLA